ncbi:MAG: Flp family type IVb pilin [Candidatus Binataceae bacterium]
MNAVSKAYVKTRERAHITARHAYAAMRENKGQTMAEYALIVGLIAVVTVTVWTTLGTQISAIVTSITTSLADA